jgi:hypothetical protein
MILDRPNLFGCVQIFLWTQFGPVQNDFDPSKKICIRPKSFGPIEGLGISKY